MASPDQVLKGVTTEVTLAPLAPDSFAAFLVAGDASCTGALAALSLRDTGDKGGGRVDAEGKLEIRLSSAQPGMCSNPVAREMASEGDRTCGASWAAARVPGEQSSL